MLANLAVVALAAAGAVNAGPLQRRQATSAVESAASSVASDASSAVSSVASEASSTAAGASSDASAASSTAASSMESMSSMASSTMMESGSSAAATSTGAAGAGNETNPAFPCPAGFLLTYAAVNQTVPMMVTQVTPAVGEWATSPLFPNVTASEGGNNPGATHTINVGNVSLPEVLVSYVANETSGSAIWTWNGSLPEPVSAMGVSLASYSTVLQIYDPDYTATGSIGNTTFINLFTNACATPQAEAMQLLMTLGGLELSNAAAALSGNSTSGGGASSTAAESASGASSTAESAASSATSGAESATSAASSGAESATSAASSAASSAESAVSSGASSAASAASSAVAAATSTSA